jgi:hypothetical protein
MNLNNMTLDDLWRLQRTLTSLQDAGQVLRRCDESAAREVVFEMVPGQPLRISASLSLSGQKDLTPAPLDDLPAPLIEDAVAAPPACGDSAPVLIVPAAAAAILELPEGCAPALASEAPTAPARHPQCPEGVALGPLTEMEKAAAQRMAKDGFDARAIATKLNRRVQTVALYLNLLARNGATAAAPAAPDEQTGPDPVPCAVAPVVMASGESVLLEALPQPAPAVPVDPPSADVADLTGRQRSLLSHLAALESKDPWTPDVDLALFEGLARGFKLGMVAVDLGVDPREAKRRFDAVVSPVTDMRGNIVLDGQRDLLVALRRRAGQV